MTLHYVTPVHPGGEPGPHYALTAYVQPMTEGMIDTRYGHADSEAVQADVPDGTTIDETAHGLVATRPDGLVSLVDTWPEPRGGRVTPSDWFDDECESRP